MRRLLVPVLLAVLVLGGCSSAPPSSAPESSASASSASASSASRVSATADTVFGFPEQMEVKSGSGEPIGTVAVFRAASSECSAENLELWCNQYLRWGLDNWAVVEYTDKPGYGVYGSGDMVEVGVSLAPGYSMADYSDAILYVFSADDVVSDGHLAKIG